ncbi:MAG: hypothetical protein PVJ57_18675, partial [Phycisphaerae bacterium]
DAEWREASAGRDRQRPLHRRRKTRESRRLITTPSTTFDNSSLSGIFGSLLGFAIAAEAIVLGLCGSDRLTIVRNSRHYSTLWRVFRWAIRSLALATVAALLALVLDRDKHPLMPFLYAAVFFSLLAGVQLARTIWVLEQVVRVVSAHKDTPDC